MTFKIHKEAKVSLLLVDKAKGIWKEAMKRSNGAVRITKRGKWWRQVETQEKMKIWFRVKSNIEDRAFSFVILSEVGENVPICSIYY